MKAICFFYNSFIKILILNLGLINNFFFSVTAEHLARTYKVSRKRQDEYAVKSQNRAEVAIKSGHFTMEIVPILSDKTHREVIEDEFPRFGTDLGKLLTLHPCFVKSDAPYVSLLTIVCFCF